MVPICPRAGVTEDIVPAVMYVNADDLVTTAPVLDVKTTSPVPALALDAVTTMLVLLVAADVIVAAVPTKVTDVMDVPPPSRLAPAIVTLVPICPLVGLTLVTVPCSRYDHAAVEVTVAPVSAVKTTSTGLGETALAALTTTTCVLVSDVIDAAVAPSVT